MNATQEAAAARNYLVFFFGFAVARFGRLRRRSGKLGVGFLAPERVGALLEGVERGQGQLVLGRARGGRRAQRVEPHEHLALGYAVFRKRQVPQLEAHLVLEGKQRW